MWAAWLGHEAGAMLGLANQHAYVHNIARGEGHVRGETSKFWKGCCRRRESNSLRQPRSTVSNASQRRANGYPNLRNPRMWE